MAKCTVLSDNISENAKKLCAEASAYLESGNPGKAVKLLESSPVTETDPELSRLLAEAYAERKWGKKATVQYLKCIEADSPSPELIQDFAEHLLDSEEHRLLSEVLSETMEKEKPGSDTAAMCIAMLYAMLGDCMTKNKKTRLQPDLIKEYLAASPKAANKQFFIKILRFLAGTPNDKTISETANRMIKIMTEHIPSLPDDRDFQNAAAEFEISLILYSNDVSPLTVLAMRTAKLRFASPSDNTDYLRYLVFDARMSFLDIVRKSPVQTSEFSKYYPFLWTLVSDFITRALNAPDLKQFIRDEIYSDLRNASPGLMKIFREKLSDDAFKALKKFVDSPEPALKRNTCAKSGKAEKIPPNSPCPCGSGKKFKKCCGLK